ncbi:hypothetical protein DVH24_008583 [Malus domestica]|uniref:Uncharacterized protein n=1 Tax=Malus domestica TaxID=3750 RepID=A0A498JQD0_MALDO|nr:hypothetical protein DVH24_008583 [Malus domestica]
MAMISPNFVDKNAPKTKTSNVTSRPGADHFPGPLHHRSTILSALGPDYALTWVTHPGSALASFSLNFGVPTEPEASELPKGLMLGRDGNIHLRITPWAMWDVTSKAFQNNRTKGLMLGRDGNIHLRITPWAMRRIMLVIKKNSHTDNNVIKLIVK